MLRASLPDAILSIAALLHAGHAELEAPGVQFLGPVADLGPVYDSARVFVAPIQFAAGVPIKMLEAIGAGLPTIWGRRGGSGRCGYQTA
jgi:glycosyltransferase involved in cell wall biosynthesis